MRPYDVADIHRGNLGLRPQLEGVTFAAMAR